MAGLLAALAIGCAPAPRPAAPTAFADPRVAAYETYVAAWSAVPIGASHRIKSIVMFMDIPKERLK
ncbi:hypothetical protein [Sorangium sp. So ce1078]|uniref:hypothetical protein n=1 Tax=Sorangium sp. So ce1078 TaxID=3133329 RepID=UPI003F621DE5